MRRIADRAEPDRGAGTFEWLALGTLAAIILVSLQLAGVLRLFTSGVSHTVCRIVASCDVRQPPRRRAIPPPVPRPDPRPTGIKVHCHAVWRLPDGTFKRCS